MAALRLDVATGAGTPTASAPRTARIWAVQWSSGVVPPMWWRLCRNELVYLQNYWGPDSGTTRGHWRWRSIYFALPVLLLALIASSRRASDPFRPLLILVPLIGAGGLGWRIWVHTHYPDAHKTHLFPTHLRVDSLFRGVLLAYVYHSSIAPGSASCDGGGPSR